MYYEEQVIDGVLCWRSDPNGAWSQLTPYELTTKLLAAKQQLMDVLEEQKHTAIEQDLNTP